MCGIVSQLPAALNHVYLSRHVIFILQICTKTLPECIDIVQVKNAVEWHFCAFLWLIPSTFPALCKQQIPVCRL